MAVVAYFWRDLGHYIAAWVRSVARRSIDTADERIAWFLFVATIPAALIGGVGETFIAEHLGEPWQIAILLAVFAVVLWIADQRPTSRHMDGLTIRDAVIIGTAQAAALAPGVSRSGITISAGRFLGLDRDTAAGSRSCSSSRSRLAPSSSRASRMSSSATCRTVGRPFFVGVLAAAASGLLAIVFLLSFVRRHTYSPFVVYRLIVAAIVLLMIATGVRPSSF